MVVSVLPFLVGVVCTSTALNSAIGRAAENSSAAGGFSGGVIWEKIAIAPEVKTCELIWAHPRSGEVFAFCNKGDVYHSTDDGQTWSLLTEKAGARPTGMIEQVVLDPKNDLRMYASSMYGGGAPFVTIDGGKTWQTAGARPRRLPGDRFHRPRSQDGPGQQARERTTASSSRGTRRPRNPPGKRST